MKNTAGRTAKAFYGTDTDTFYLDSTGQAWLIGGENALSKPMRSTGIPEEAVELSEQVLDDQNREDAETIEEWRDDHELPRTYESWNERHHRKKSAAIWVESRSERQEFERHVSKWKLETGHLSVLAKRTSHESHLRIIALAAKSREILRLLLLELQSEPDHWFTALRAATGEDPVQEDCDFDQAVEAWMNWARARSIL